MLHFGVIAIFHRQDMPNKKAKEPLLSGMHHQWGAAQVWPLTHFYPVDISKSRIGIKKSVFKKRTIKVCVSFSQWCRPGNSAPSVAHQTVSLYLFSPEAIHEVSRGSLNGNMSAQKALQGS